nr:acetoin utilization AcuB family protein [Metabacillus kandeliae]
MAKDVATLSPEHTLLDAIDLCKKQRIRHIPILSEDGLLAGIVSDRDLKDASPSIFHLQDHMDELKKPLKSIMKTDVVTAHPLNFVEEVSAIFSEHRISCLPILKYGKLVGMVTESDLLHTFVQLTGADQPGSQIEIKVPNVSGKLSEVSGVFQKRNVNISSVLVYPDQDQKSKILVFRVQTMNPSLVISDLVKEGYTVLWPNVPGLST